ncbi:MAG TPA: DNA-processing protein DprA, partial [Actinomycetota bacterium]|nr:DNA-processing protein DprA [Actinomycetota bacterium]
AYPSEHAALSEWVASNGALVGEFAPGTGPRQWHFPARNRIVSGLSIAVVVVEAGLSSGALITAGFAIDQGREVFACITAPENPSGAGVRELLRDGARLVVDPDDTTHELLDLARAQGYTLPGPEDAAPAARIDLTGDAALVYGAVAEQTTVDEVVSITGLNASRASVVLATLELEGLVCDDGGGRWRRTQSR